MTRLDPNGEPSMEEILASIRKIIAEDPPGSRPGIGSPATAPAAASGPAPTAKASSPVAGAAPRSGDAAAQSRGSYFPTLGMPPRADAAPSPVPAESPAAEKSAPLSSGPRFTSTSFIPKTDLPAGRVEPSFSAMSEPRKEVPAAAAPKADEKVDDKDKADDKSDPLDIEAQLSDLLGSDLAPERPADAEPVTPAEAPAVASASFVASAPAPTASAPLVSTSAAPRFTVSRDGYSPEYSPEAKSENKISTADERDPFDFDLGPSPFTAKAEGAERAEDALKAEDAAKTLAEAEAAKDALAAVFDPFASTGPKIKAPELSVPAERSAPTAEAAPEAKDEAAPKVSDAAKPESGEAPEPAAALSPSMLSPSVSATVGPDLMLSASDRQEEAIGKKDEAAKAPAGSGDETLSEAVKPGVAFKRDVMEFASALSSADLSGSKFVERDDLDASPVMAQGPSGQPGYEAGLPMTQADAHQRSMEDTVAELLRPMLRTWLAENMPRIVERALMREIDAQLTSVDRKTAAE